MKPWRFCRYWASGYSHVVVDADDRVIASHLSVRKGALIASAPEMLNALQDIAAIDQGPAGQLAKLALERVAANIAAAESGD